MASRGNPLTSNIATQFLGGSNFAYFGFGAGTGGLSNTQSVRNISVTATFEGQTPGNSPPIAVNDPATTPAGTRSTLPCWPMTAIPTTIPSPLPPCRTSWTAPQRSTTSPTTRSPIPPPRASAVLAALPTRSPTERRRDPRKSPAVTYTPALGYSGPDSFTYTITDGTTTSSPATVNVTVTPPPGAVTLTPHGSASVANNVFTLTTARRNQAGTAMSTGRIDVRQNFTVAFDVNLGTSDGGADGAAIVLHNDPRGVNAIGAPGSGLAVGGIQNGLAIEFDTYNSSAADLSGSGMPGSDIASDHTDFLDTNSAFATTPVALPNIENGAWHPVSVTWNATTQTLSYTFDGQPMGTPLTSNIATQFLGGSNFAYFGFGAGTGGLSNTQSVRNISVTATFEGQTPAVLAMVVP